MAEPGPEGTPERFAQSVVFTVTLGVNPIETATLFAGTKGGEGKSTEWNQHARLLAVCSALLRPSGQPRKGLMNEQLSC